MKPTEYQVIAAQSPARGSGRAARLGKRAFGQPVTTNASELPL